MHNRYATVGEVAEWQGASNRDARSDRKKTLINEELAVSGEGSGGAKRGNPHQPLNAVKDPFFLVH